MRKKMIFLLICILALFCLTGSAWATEKYRIQVENRLEGEIRISHDLGKTWEKTGQVVLPATKLSLHGFAASTYGQPGAVVASAVNSIHVKVRQEDRNAVLFSLLPLDTMAENFNPQSYFSSSSSIFTDIPAGSGLFGGDDSPFVGSIIRLGETLQPLPEDYLPREGDLLTILVEKPKERMAQLIFENKVGGKVIARYFNGEKRQVAEVKKPVRGVGRFTGTHYAAIGRIRANHPGVICISTSPVGEVGGFQIIPNFHASQLDYTAGGQWMVVAPFKTKDFLEGKEPLFAQYLQPKYRSGDWQENYLVDVRINDGAWQSMPLVTGLSQDALQAVTEIRILFPTKE